MKNKFAVAIGGLFILFITLYFGSGNKPNPTGSTVKNLPASLKDMIGKPAPEFSLPSYQGQNFTLGQMKGKKIVLFYNEGIMCYPACWNQMVALGTDRRLNNEKVVTASIVTDTKNQWIEAVKKMPELGKETMLLDTNMLVSRQYRMLDLPSSMHKGSKPGHTYVIVDENGIIRYASDDPKMGVQNDTLVEELSKI